MATQTRSRASLTTAQTEDVGNIVSLEHVNITVPDQRMATIFYVMGLGFTRDPFYSFGDENMWLNLGEQQVHLPTRGVQVIPGHVAIVVPSLAALADRLASVEGKLAGTLFSWRRVNGHIEATCPWGNRFVCSAGGREYPDLQRGIPSVEFLVRPGTAAGIVRFYQDVMGAPGSVRRKDGLALGRVDIGAGQSLRFQETPEPLRRYDGHHVAVYVANVSRAYGFCQERGIVMQELDRHQFRFKDIVDVETGALLHQLEHEVRTMRHPMYKRALVNRED